MVDIGLLLVCNLCKKCVCSSFFKEEHGSSNMFLLQRNAYPYDVTFMYIVYFSDHFQMYRYLSAESNLDLIVVPLNVKVISVAAM